MKKTCKQILPRALGLILIFTVLCGGIYTLVVTGVAQLFFADKANGSIIEVDGKKYGSELLAQQYTDDAHLWGRVMSLDFSTFTKEDGTPAVYAWASNASPADESYKELIAERVEKIRASNPDKGSAAIPADLVTISGSGFDPHISVAAAEYQIPRIVKASGKSEQEVKSIISKYTTGRTWGFMGEPVVNVLQVNLALDGILK